MLNALLERMNLPREDRKCFTLREQWLGVLLVIALSTLIRAIASSFFPITGDEKEALATVEGILQGHHYIYMFHSTYLAPLCEYMAAGLAYFFGAPLTSLRAVYVFWSAVAAGFWWWLFAGLLPSRFYRVLLGLFLAFPSFSNLDYELPGPAYASGRFLIGILVWLTLYFPSRPKWWHYAVLAIAAGISIYIFPLCKVPFLFCLLWLALRDGGLFTACCRAWNGHKVQWRFVFVICTFIAGLSLGLAAYHFLTRPTHYQMPHRVLMLWGVGAIFGVAASVMILRTVRWNWLNLAPVVVVLAGALFIARIPESVFRAELAKLPLEEQQKYGDFTDFVLEQSHNWGVRTRFTVEHIAPQIFMGQLFADQERAGSGYVTDVPLVPWRLLLGGGMIAILLTGVVRGIYDPATRGALFITGGCALLTLVLLMITYKAANLYNYRYLGVFSPGLFLAIAAAFQFSRWGLALLSLMTILGCIDLIRTMIFLNPMTWS